MSDNKPPSSGSKPNPLQKLGQALSALAKPSSPKATQSKSLSLSIMGKVKKNWDRDSLKQNGFKQILGKPGGRFGVMAKIDKNWDRTALKKDGFKQILGKPGGRFGVMAKVEKNWETAKNPENGFRQIYGPKPKTHAQEGIEMTDLGNQSKARKKAHEFEDVDLRRKGGDNNGGDGNASSQLAKRKRANSF